MLLVDDGSSDCSLEICERYSRIDNRINTIHQNNQGATSARNTALLYAEGQYIIFLDSDDYWIYSDVLSTLVFVADKYRLGLVRGEYIRVSENAQFRVCSDSKVDREYSVERFSSSQFFREAIHHEFFGPLTLFRRCSINTKFDENKRLLEDMLFYSRILTQNLSC